MPKSLQGWEGLDHLAKRYGSRPADICDVTDPYLAYCVDEAAALAGSALERRIWEEAREQADEKRPTSARSPARSPVRKTGPAELELDNAGFSLRGKMRVLKRQADGSYK